MAGAFATLLTAVLAWGFFVERRLVKLCERQNWMAVQLGKLTGERPPWE